MNKMLPKGWILTKLANVTTHPQYGWTCSSTNSGSLKLLRTTDISDGKINWETVPYCSIEPKDYNKYLIQNNDILVSRAGSVGISYRISESDLLHPTVFASYLIRFCPFIPPNFVEHYFKSHHYWHYISDSQLGIAVPNVNATKLSDLPFPLPPLDEQKRIVDKLDQIILRIDLLKERLDKIPAIIKRFRQSVLTAAITGRLTEQWRINQSDLEDIDKSILVLKNERLKSCSTLSQKSKIKAVFEEVEVGDNDLLPHDWKFTFLKKLCHSFQYGTSSKSSENGEVPVIRMGNLQNGNIDWNDLVYTSDAAEIEKYQLQNGDVLFNRTNSPALVGKTSIYRNEKKAIFAGYLIKINNYPILNSYYLNYALNTSYAKVFCNQVKTDGVNQSNINAQKLGNFEIPLPPLEEQEEIVRQVDKLFALADKLESHYQKAKARVDKLSQSVLAKAFRGELVITEAELAEKEGRDFESAEKLLERILEEKAKLTGSKKSPRVRKKIKQGNERNNK